MGIATTRHRRQRAGRALSERQRLLRTVSEDGWLTQVMEEMKRRNWWVTHFRPGRFPESERVATMLQGKPGLPDVLGIRPPRVLFAELKREGYGDLRLDGRGYLTAVDVTQAERICLAALAHCPGVETYIWTPSDWPSLLRVIE